MPEEYRGPYSSLMAHVPSLAQGMESGVFNGRKIVNIALPGRTRHGNLGDGILMEARAGSVVDGSGEAKR